MKTIFDITGMTCAACSAHVEKSVRAVDGVRTATVDLVRGRMIADFDETVTDPEEICRAVEKGGYGAAVSGREKDRRERRHRQRGKTRGGGEKASDMVAGASSAAYVSVNGTYDRSAAANGISSQ